MTNQSDIYLEEGKYAIQVQALKKEADKQSAMAGYLSESAIVTKQDDNIFVTFMLKDDKIIKKFQVSNESGEWVAAIDYEVNKETNTRFELFQLERLIPTLHVRVQYEVEHEGQIFQGDETLRLVFDEESLDTVDNI